MRIIHGQAHLIYGHVNLIRTLSARAFGEHHLTIIMLIGVPAFIEYVSAAPVSPSSPLFGGNGY